MVKLNCTKLNFARKNHKYFSAAQNIGWRHYVTIFVRAYRNVYAPGTVYNVWYLSRGILFDIFDYWYKIFSDSFW